MKIPEYHLELDVNEFNILAADRLRERPATSGPQDLYDFCVREYRMDKLAEEKMLMIAFNNKMKPIAVFVVSQGTVNSTIVDARSIYIKALLCGAVSIALVHNHPSGDPTPSQEDMDVTNRVVAAGEVLGVRCVDHLVIGKGSYYSILKGEMK